MTKYEFIQLLVNLPVDVRQETCQLLQDSLDVDSNTDTLINKLMDDTANDATGPSLVAHNGDSHEP